MPLKHGTSAATVSGNIKEMVKSGHPLKQAIAASLTMKRKSKKMAEGGMVEDQDMFHEMQEKTGSDSEYPTMEPDMDGPNKVQSMGPEESDKRDAIDQGGSPKPKFDSNVDLGSPAHKMDTDMPLSEELMEILKRRKARYSQE